MTYLSGYWGIGQVFIISLKEFEPCVINPAIKREPSMGSFLMGEMIVVRVAFASSADFRTDDTNNNDLGELVRIARIPNWLSRKAHK